MREELATKDKLTFTEVTELSYPEPECYAKQHFSSTIRVSRPSGLLPAAAQRVVKIRNGLALLKLVIHAVELGLQ